MPPACAGGQVWPTFAHVGARRVQPGQGDPNPAWPRLAAPNRRVGRKMVAINLTPAGAKGSVDKFLRGNRHDFGAMVVRVVFPAERHPVVVHRHQPRRAGVRSLARASGLDTAQSRTVM